MAMEKEFTPKSLGFSMPAEWGPHKATWMSWPKNPLTFPHRLLAQVEGVFALMCSALSHGEEARVLFDDSKSADRAVKLIEKAGATMRNVKPVIMKSADVWIRDYGPTFLLSKSGKKSAVKWKFNAWGGKYDDLMYDDRTGYDILSYLSQDYFEPGIVMEGGSIDVNGSGSMLTTSQCLLNKNRNPNLSKAQIEKYLLDYTGVSNFIWLSSGIEGDDTDGHVDDFARFAGKSLVLCASGSVKGGLDSRVLSQNMEILDNSTDEDGNGLEIAKLPLPRPLIDKEEGRKLPASYANFYIGNKAVLLPVFNDKADKEAIEVLESCFPGREIVPIEASSLVFGYGGIHCATQQEPKGA
ncbi:MAG: agmatine deiminase family protein [Candidatus Micrarchaeia archaeon]